MYGAEQSCRGCSLSAQRTGTGSKQPGMPGGRGLGRCFSGETRLRERPTVHMPSHYLTGQLTLQELSAVTSTDVPQAETIPN